MQWSGKKLWKFKKKNLNKPLPEKKIFIFCWADILLFVNWCWASVYYIFSLMPGNHLIISSVLDIVSPDPTGTKLKTEYLQPPTIATRNNLPAWICFLYILVQLEKIFFFFLVCVSIDWSCWLHYTITCLIERNVTKY